MLTTTCGCQEVVKGYTRAEQILLEASGKDYEYKKKIYGKKIPTRWQKELIKAVKVWHDPRLTDPDQAYIGVAENFFDIWKKVNNASHKFLVAAEFHYFQSATMPDLESVLPSDVSGGSPCVDDKKTKNKTSLEEMRDRIDSILEEHLANNNDNDGPRNARGWCCLGYYLIARADYERARWAFMRAIEYVSRGKCPLYENESSENVSLLDVYRCDHGYSTCPVRDAWAGLSSLDSEKAVYETDMDKERLLLTNAYARVKGFFPTKSESELKGGPINSLYLYISLKCGKKGNKDETRNERKKGNRDETRNDNCISRNRCVIDEYLDTLEKLSDNENPEPGFGMLQKSFLKFSAADQQSERPSWTFPFVAPLRRVLTINLLFAVRALSNPAKYLDNYAINGFFDDFVREICDEHTLLHSVYTLRYLTLFFPVSDLLTLEGAAPVLSNLLNRAQRGARHFHRLPCGGQSELADLRSFNNSAITEILFGGYGAIENFLNTDAKRKHKWRQACSERELKAVASKEECTELIFMQEWNSDSPLYLDRTETPQVGGGCLLWNKCKDEDEDKTKSTGIVIDPGIDFLSQFYAHAHARAKDQEHLSFRDINSIIVTHSHIDHSGELEALAALCHRANKLRNDEKTLSEGMLKLGRDPVWKAMDGDGDESITLYLSIGTFKRNSGWLDLRSKDYKVKTIDCGSELPDLPKNLKCKVIRAWHDEVISRDHSVGLVFSAELAKDKKCVIAFTSDSAFQPAKGRGCCDMADNIMDNGWNEDKVKGRVLVVNIGSLGEREIEIYMGRCPSNSRYDNHLGLTGTLDLITRLEPKPDLVIISEFGEEFRGSRESFCNALAKVLGLHKRVFPASRKLHLKFAKGTESGIDIEIECTGHCGNFSEWNKTTTYEEEGVLKYLCPDCRREAGM